MGRQIRFFAVKDDYKKLCEELLLHDIIILSSSGNKLDPNDRKFFTVFGCALCYLTKEEFSINYTSDNTFNPWTSEVIEFMDCHPCRLKQPNHNGYDNIRTGYEYGRLWYDPNFYDENFNKIPKCKELTSMYETLKRYIRKNYRISKNKFGYIGPYAYAEYLKGNYIPCSGKYRIEF